MKVIDNVCNFSNRNDYTIVIDENLRGLYTRLVERSKLSKISTVVIHSKDKVIHHKLNKLGMKKGPNHPLILITKDFDDFLEFSPRYYYILGIVGSNKDMNMLCNAVLNALRDPNTHSDFRTKGESRITIDYSVSHQNRTPYHKD